MSGTKKWNVLEFTRLCRKDTFLKDFRDFEFFRVFRVYGLYQVKDRHCGSTFEVSKQFLQQSVT